MDMIDVVFGLFCLIFLWFVFISPVVTAIVKISKNPLYKRNFITTKGVITSAAQGRADVSWSRLKDDTWYFHNFTVRFADGKTAEYQSKCGMSKELKPGTEITVKLNPNNPLEAEIKCFEAYFNPFTKFTFITLPLIIFVGLILIFGKYYGEF